MTLPTFGLICFGVLLNACAQLLLKAGVAPLGAIALERAALWSSLWRLAHQWPIFAGLTCYVISVGVWIVGLSRVDVSVAYPLLSLGYVVNAFAAWWLFGEILSPLRCGGILIILLGVYMVARSAAA